MALSPAALETYVEHYRRDRHREAEQAALVALARRARAPARPVVTASALAALAAIGGPFSLLVGLLPKFSTK